MFPVKQNLAICALASTLLLGAAPLPDEGGTGRFTMTPADNGVLKLDTQTGAMSMCSRKGASWACETLPDDRQKLQTEIDRLAAENQDLKATVKRFHDYCEKEGFKLHDRNFTLRYESNIPPQVGMAGSSAIICAWRSVGKPG